MTNSRSQESHPRHQEHSGAKRGARGARGAHTNNRTTLACCDVCMYVMATRRTKGKGQTCHPRAPVQALAHTLGSGIPPEGLSDNNRDGTWEEENSSPFAGTLGGTLVHARSFVEGTVLKPFPSFFRPFCCCGRVLWTVDWLLLQSLFGVLYFFRLAAREWCFCQRWC